MSSTQDQSTSAGTSSSDRGRFGRRKTAGFFDIRTFIGMLLAFDGVVILLAGFFGTSSADERRAGGVNINLWVGVGLLVAAAVFEGWKRLRPVKVDESALEASDSDAASGTSVAH